MSRPSVSGETPAESKTDRQTALFNSFDAQSITLSQTHEYLQSVVSAFYSKCIYQGLMGGVELLQDLVHDGVGEIGNH